MHSRRLKSTATLREPREPRRHRKWRRLVSSYGGWRITVKKKKIRKGWRQNARVAGRMQLFRRAFTSRICDRHLLYSPLYIPGTVLHPSCNPPVTSSTPLTLTHPSHAHTLVAPYIARSRMGEGCREEHTPSSPTDRPTLALSFARGILFSYSLGSDSPA